MPASPLWIMTYGSVPAIGMTSAFQPNNFS
jgi:hypothetical protein